MTRPLILDSFTSGGASEGIRALASEPQPPALDTLDQTEGGDLRDQQETKEKTNAAG